MQSRSLLDEALEGFPKSEIWRIQTDGCQAKKDPSNFRAEFIERYNNLKKNYINNQTKLLKKRFAATSISIL